MKKVTEPKRQRAQLYFRDRGPSSSHRLCFDQNIQGRLQALHEEAQGQALEASQLYQQDVVRGHPLQGMDR